jgi:hypothetical protein
VAKKNGRWCLVRPDGRADVLFGINHLNLAKSTSGLAAQLRGWGFNAAGYGTPDDVARELPYFAATGVVHNPYYAVYPEDRKGEAGVYRFPDVFSPAWQKTAADVQRAAVVRNRANPNLLGYLWTDVPTWDLPLARAMRGADWVSAIRGLEETAPGKRRYAAFLGERYAGRFGELALLYGVQGESLDRERFASVALGHPSVGRDDRAFLGLIAQEYYRAAGTQRAHDPGRLVFGDRYLIDDCPDEVIAAARSHIDVVSVQTGDGPTPLHMRSDVFQKAALDRLYRLTGKPILICDHQISFPTPDQPHPIWTELASQKEAAAATREYLRAAFDTEYVIGYCRCQYVDQQTEIMLRGPKRGLVNEQGEPYAQMVDAYRSGFAEIRQRLRL